MRRVVLGAVTAMLLVAGSLQLASAHVTVWPMQAAPGDDDQVYTVHVPTEEAVPTVKVEVRFPAGLTVYAIEPKPGWTYEIEKDAAGHLTGVIWSGGTIGPGEFDEFAFLATNPDKPGSLAFRAYQTYADGSVVSWDGPPDSQFPASVVSIGSGAASAGDAPAATSDAAPLDATGTFWLGVAALVVAGAALGVSALALRRRAA